MFGDNDAAILNRLRKIGNKVDDVSGNMSSLAKESTSAEMLNVINRMDKQMDKQNDTASQVSYDRCEVVCDTLNFAPTNNFYLTKLWNIAIDDNYIYILSYKYIYILNKSTMQLQATLTVNNDQTYTKPIAPYYMQNEQYIWFWGKMFVLISKETLSIVYKIESSANLRIYWVAMDAPSMRLYIAYYNGNKRTYGYYDFNIKKYLIAVDNFAYNIFSDDGVFYGYIDGDYLVTYSSKNTVAKKYNKNNLAVIDEKQFSLQCSALMKDNDMLYIAVKNQLMIYDSAYTLIKNIDMSTNSCINRITFDNQYIYCFLDTSRCFIFNKSNYNLIGWCDSPCDSVECGCDGVHFYNIPIIDTVDSNYTWNTVVLRKKVTVL